MSLTNTHAASPVTRSSTAPSRQRSPSEALSMYVLSALFGVPLVVFLLIPVLGTEKGRRSVGLALRSLWLHRLRSFLSVLGIIIGTAAVISLMAFGEGSMQDALDDIKRMGATNIIVRSVKPPDGGSNTQLSRVATYGVTKGDYARI